MALTPLDNRFFSSTRGQVLIALRRGPRTVEQLASALGLSHNTVRSHIGRLEQDERVQPGGSRRGNSKPAGLYQLTPAAEQLFSQAYAPVLRQLLDVLREQLPAEQLLDLLREVGQRLARQQRLDVDHATPREQLTRVQALLDDLGGRNATNTTDQGR